MMAAILKAQDLELVKNHTTLVCTCDSCEWEHHSHYKETDKNPRHIALGGARRHVRRNPGHAITARTVNVRKFRRKD